MDGTQTLNPEGGVAGGEMIAVRSLTKRFGTGASPVVALSDIDFTVNEGELVVVVGPLRLWQVDFAAHPVAAG